MNERIKQLADQAEDYATAEYEKWIPTPDFSGIPNIRKIFNKKFAQLIVAECMRLNSKELSITAIERLLPVYEEHFGVEE